MKGQLFIVHWLLAICHCFDALTMQTGRTDSTRSPSTDRGPANPVTERSWKCKVAQDARDGRQ
jgi:hypothetical protein